MTKQYKLDMNQIACMVGSIPLGFLLFSCLKSLWFGGPAEAFIYDATFYNWFHLFGIPVWIFLLPYAILFYFFRTNNDVLWVTKLAICLSTAITLLDPFTPYYGYFYLIVLIGLTGFAYWGLNWSERKKRQVDFGLYPLALDPKGRTGFPTNSLHMNVQIVGGTGTGKTYYAIKPFIEQTIAQGLGCFIYDVKGNMAQDVANSFEQAGLCGKKGFFHFDLADPSNSHTYNPLYGKNPDAIANRIHTALYYDTRNTEVYYVDLAKAFLQNLVGLLMKEIKTLTFMDLLIATEEAETFRTIQWFCAKYPDSFQARYFRNQWLWKAPKQRQEELSGLVTKLQRFCNSGWAHLLNVRDPDITMDHIFGSDGVFLFSPDAARYPEDAKPLSILAMMDLAEQTADRQRNKPEKPFRVFLDEFYNLAYPRFIDFINKCREAEVNLFLAHQSLGDLEGVSHEFMEQIMNTASNKIVLRVNDPDTAEFFAREFGTEEDEDYQVESFKSDGTMAGYAKPKVEKFRFHPNLIKGLQAGQAIVKVVGVGTPVIFQTSLKAATPIPEFFNPRSCQSSWRGRRSGGCESSLPELMKPQGNVDKKPGKNTDRLMGDKDAA